MDATGSPRLPEQSWAKEGPAPNKKRISKQDNRINQIYNEVKELSLPFKKSR
jgi:hypothetical protein